MVVGQFLLTNVKEELLVKYGRKISGTISTLIITQINNVILKWPIAGAYQKMLKIW